jgi:hypothetical protein
MAKSKDIDPNIDSSEALKSIAANMSPEEFAFALLDVGKFLPQHNIAMRKLFHGSE